INLFFIAAQLKASTNNIDDESFMTSEEENNPCQLKEAGKNNNFTKDRHVITSDHKMICAARMQFQVTLYSSFAIQARADQIKFKCSVDILNIFNDFSIDDERALYSSYQNNVAAYEFIESIGRVIEQEVFQELRNSDGWSIMLDESNTISTEKVLAIVSKHLIAPAQPLYRFLGLISLTNNTANTIVAEIDRFIQTKNLLYNKLMHIYTDGASIMT
ncbi:19966_t:CDS:2, partial [Racocetra fulgida]